MTPESRPTPSIAHMPVSLFASVMGIGGLAVAWRRAADVFDVGTGAATVLAWVALGVFALVTLAYSTKAIRVPRAVWEEWTHPVKMAFVATIPIALLVLAPALLPHHPRLAEALWWPGMVAQGVLTVAIVRGWMRHPKLRMEHVHPGWFIPAVGNIVVPLAGVQFAPSELTWFFFSIGLLWWIALLPVVLVRLMTAEPLPPRLLPTLAVLISPPAVGAIAWVKVGGAWGDPLSTILLSVAVFQGVLLLAQIPELSKAPMGPANWAYTFPLAALTAALLADAAATGCGVCKWLGVGFLGLASAVVVWVTMCTIRSIVTRTLLVPDPVPVPAAKA